MPQISFRLRSANVLATATSILLLYIAVFSFSGCGKQPARIDSKGTIEIKPKQQVEMEKREAGTWKEKLVGGGPDGSDLLYTIHVPEGLEDKTDVPLVFALHFGGRVTAHYGKTMLDALVLPGLGELNAIIIAPDSLKGGWNSAQNKEAVSLLYDAVVETYSIDKKKTLVTGFSMGGHGAYYYALNHPEMFTAALPIAGDPGTGANEADLVIPMYTIHSTRDTVVNIKPTREFVEAQKAKGADITFVELDDLTHYQSPAYAEPLKQAVPWVKKVWAGEK